MWLTNGRNNTTNTIALTDISCFYTCVLVAFTSVQAAAHNESFLQGLRRLICISPQSSFANDPCFFPDPLSLKVYDRPASSVRSDVLE